MIKLGEIQKLEIIKKVEFGVYLADKETQAADKVLLPAKQVPREAKIGDEIEVFVYRDSKDRLIATTTRPLITLGNVARLRVVQTGQIGAFLDWGLEKFFQPPVQKSAYLASLHNPQSGYVSKRNQGSCRRRD